MFLIKKIYLITNYIIIIPLFKHILEKDIIFIHN